MGMLEDDLARKLRSPLMQRVYMDHWQAPKACKEVGSYKRVEKSRKRQLSPTEKYLKRISKLISRFG
jgi:hypothetical protein